MLEDVLTLLSAAGVGTKGVDLFAGTLPEVPVNAVGVKQYGGGNPTHTMGGSLAPPAVERPRFQIVARNSSQSLAWVKARAVRNALRFYEGTPGSVKFHIIWQIGDLGELPQDEGLNYRVAGSFEVVRDP